MRWAPPYLRCAIDTVFAFNYRPVLRSSCIFVITGRCLLDNRLLRSQDGVFRGFLRSEDHRVRPKTMILCFAFLVLES